MHAGGGNSILKPGKGLGEKSRGLTASKGGVPLLGKGRRRRKHYPSSWVCPAKQMWMKQRGLCVFDGGRRLWKDDMMLDNEFEVRTSYTHKGQSYDVTDLDEMTYKRAEALLDATPEEKGEEVDLQQLMS